jgi:hypothetical protein
MNKEETKAPSILSIDKKIDIMDKPNYTEDQKTYLKNLLVKIKFAKEERDNPREEFDGLTYLQYWQQNERWANTFIEPKKNRTDIKFQTGILRTKLFALVSSIISLNLKPDVVAYDSNNVKISALGNAIEDIMDKTEEMENDEEKQLMRIYELFKQGTVFVEEVWKKETLLEKTITSEFDGKFDTKNWKQEIQETEGQPVRNLISGKDVFLGNLKEYLSQNQPFLYTIQTKTYDECKAIYGEWEMWKYVARTKTQILGSVNETYLDTNWSLNDNPEGEVEIIKYQDVRNNEFQILINGVPMLPVGYPLPWGRRYNIEQQNLEPIRSDFAYGKSFIFKNKNTVQLLDEMLRMASLKTYSSFKPPYLNTSGVLIPQDVLAPGKITMGVPAGSLKPVSELAVQGVTNGEFSMIQEIKNFVDQNTVSQTFGGMKEQGTQTATQVIELQRQARIMLGVSILAVSLMEKKIAGLRLFNILQNWFNPVDTVLDDARNEIKNRYRIISRERSIQNEGAGIRYVVPTEEKVSVDDLMAEEGRMEAETGKPTRIIIVNPEELKQAKYLWLIVINPREKKSSELNKLMFRQKIADAMALGLPLNQEYVKEQFAEVWGDDPTKMFTAQQPIPPGAVPGEAGSMAGVPGTPGGINIKQPAIDINKTMDSANNANLQ